MEKAFLKQFLIVTLVLLVGIIAACHPMLFSGLQRVQTDPGDTRLNNYILEHSYQWLAGNPLHKDFWSPPVFFPVSNTAAYGDILLGAAPPYWLCRLLGIYPDTSFQLWIMVAFALNFLSAFLVFRVGMKFVTLASAAGAYFFAFASMRVIQMGHQQLIPQFFSMLAVFALCCIYHGYTEANGPRRRLSFWIGVLAAAVVLQLYTAFYLGWFFCFGLLVFLGVAAFWRETRSTLFKFIQEYRWTLLAVALCALACLSWMGYHYLLTYREFGGRAWTEALAQVPRPLSWFDLGRSSWLYGWTWGLIPFSRIPMEHEHRIGLGLLTLGLAVVGLAKLSRTPWGKILAVSCLIIFSLAFLYPGGWSPWRAVYKVVPGATAIRGVSRIALLLLIGFSFGLVYFFNSLKSKVLALSLLCLVILEQGQTTSAYDKYVVRAQVDNIVRLIPQSGEAFFYADLNFDHRNNVDLHQLDAMWAALVVGVPTMNGYHGWFPRDWHFNFFYKEKIAQPADMKCIPEMVRVWVQQHGFDGYRVIPVQRGDDFVYLLPRGQQSFSAAGK